MGADKSPGNHGSPGTNPGRKQEVCSQPRQGNLNSIPWKERGFSCLYTGLINADGESEGEDGHGSPLVWRKDQ